MRESGVGERRHFLGCGKEGSGKAPAADDDKVLAAAADEELLVVQKAQISCAQILSTAACRCGSKFFASLFLLVPVALRLGRRVDPDFTHIAFRKYCTTLRIDNVQVDRFTAVRKATADE